MGQIFRLNDYKSAVTGTSSNDAPIFHAAFAAMRQAGGGILEVPDGSFYISRTVQITPTQYAVIRGQGDKSRIIATSELDGSDHITRNAVFNATYWGAAKFTGVGTGRTGITADTTLYRNKLIIEHLMFDSTAQNVKGLIGTYADKLNEGGGFNLCTIEVNDYHRPICRYITVVGGYGNGITFGTLCPGAYAAMESPIIEHCIFERVIKGPLPTYGDPGISGSVVQIGAARGGRISFNEFHHSGGPAIDVFNCMGLSIDHNYIGYGIDRGTKQFLGSIHSDFGLLGCQIHHNRFFGSGSIWLGGIDIPIFANNWTPTAGPSYCQITDNMVFGFHPANVGRFSPHPTLFLDTGNQLANNMVVI